MKKILCFGDSNTWGYNPKNGSRYDKSIRWTGILFELLKEKYEIIEAGCNNRTVLQNNSFIDELTGYKIIEKYLNNSFDIVILALGINDTQKVYNVTIEDIKTGINDLVIKIKRLSENSKIILVCPSELNDNVLSHGYFSNLFDENSIEKSKRLPKIYLEIASNNNCKLIDLNKITPVSDTDGLHYSIDAHKKIAQAFYQILTKPKFF